MQQPPYLKKGDSVMLISTARKISKKEIVPAVKIFEAWGLNVVFGEHLFEIDNQFAGTVQQRVSDLQEALNNDKYKAVICARGGYGTVQLIDSIDFSVFSRSPKWLVGYSDVTVLHNHINQNLGIETLHAVMPVNISDKSDPEILNNLKNTLFGELQPISFELNNYSTVSEFDCKAPIVGGNLSIIYSLTGTACQLSTEGKFLFIEDLDEYLYHIDRMMVNLRRAGLFKGCKALLVGGMSDMNDNTVPYGKTAEEIIKDNLKDFDIPLIFGIPSGHIDRNFALILNRDARVKIKSNIGEIAFSER